MVDTRLRDYIYLDMIKIIDYCSAIEYGLTVSSTEQKTEKKIIDAEAGLGHVVQVESSLSKITGNEKKKQLTRSSLFQLVYDYIQKQKLSQTKISGETKSFTNGLKKRITGYKAISKMESRGIIEVVCSIEVPTIVYLMELAQNLSEITSFTPKDQQFLQMLQSQKKFHLKLTPVDDKEVVLITTLNTQHICTEYDELDGECVILGKIRERTNDFSLVSWLPGYEHLSEEERLELVDNPQLKAFLKESKNIELKIQGEATIIDPIAIYRY